VGSVPGGDLISPANDGAAEPAYFGRTGSVLEVVAKPVDELDGQVGVVVVIDAADDFFGVPGHANIASGVAGFEQAEASTWPMRAGSSTSGVP
jgi:hypothetical protein